MENNRLRLAALLAMASLCVVSFILIRLVIPQLTNKKTIDLPVNNISQITVTLANITQVLDKRKDSWRVSVNGKTFEGDKQKIQTLLETINAIKPGSPVSTNPRKHSLFGIGKNAITLQGNGYKKTIYLGDTQEGDDIYFRMDNDSSVYTGQNMGHVFREDDYRQLRVPLGIDQEQIRAIAIDYEGKQYEVVASGQTWKIDDIKMSDTAVGYYLENIKDLKASDIVDAIPQGTSNRTSLTLTLKDLKNEAKVRFFDLDDQHSIAATSANNLYYVLPKVEVSSLMKVKDDFIKAK